MDAMSRTPVSWKVVEPGWALVARGGERVGSVVELAGDVEADIFHGLVVELDEHEGRRLVEPERVAEIVEGEVRLTLSTAQVPTLSSYEPPPAQLAVTGESASWLERLRTWLGGGVSGRREQ
jgi:hypothetical protein